eukprot:CAMPEP_0116946354 /NCGR_PEP_ID=MMETSP0467-20121206/36928_1 /TAXON_ID=283647 /ORGANISM="Mesodinium pulex, Strain SPMC105" /LENGTH=62 /DNA_ID=CAMNT_0004630101 /DNA_START=450 /DNA_END=638 /DNA_ORIENTATION=-
MTFNESSALKNQNIEDSFLNIVREIIDDMKETGVHERKKKFKSSKLLDEIVNKDNDNSRCRC